MHAKCDAGAETHSNYTGAERHQRKDQSVEREREREVYRERDALATCCFSSKSISKEKLQNDLKAKYCRQTLKSKYLRYILKIQ